MTRAVPLSYSHLREQLHGPLVSKMRSAVVFVLMVAVIIAVCVFVALHWRPFHEKKYEQLQQTLKQTNLDLFDAIASRHPKSPIIVSIQIGSEHADTLERQASEIWDAIPPGTVTSQCLNGKCSPLGDNQKVEALRKDAQTEKDALLTRKMALIDDIAARYPHSDDQLFVRRRLLMQQISDIESKYIASREGFWPVKILLALPAIVGVAVAAPWLTGGEGEAWGGSVLVWAGIGFWMFTRLKKIFRAGTPVVSP